MTTTPFARPAWLPLPQPAALAGGLANTLATRIALFLVVLSLFTERYEMHGYTSGSLPLPDMYFFAAMALVAVKIAADSTLNCARAQPLRSLDLALIGLVALIGAISIVPAILDGYAGQTFKTFIHLSGLLVCALALGRSLNETLVRFMLRSYLTIGVAVCTLGILQAFDQNVTAIGISDALGLKSKAVGDFVRPESVFSEPAYLGYSALICILIAHRSFTQTRSRLAAGAIAVGIVTILVTSAMGPIVIGLALTGFMMLTGRVSRVSPGLIGALAVAGALLLLSPAGGSILDRADSILNGNDASASSRGEMNSASIELWNREPITGVGLGNSRFYFAELVYIPGVSAQAEFPAANVYLALLGEVGPLALLALLAVLMMFIRGERRWTDTASSETLIRMMLLLTAMQFFVIGNFLLPPFWFWAGMRLGVQPEAAREGNAA